MRVKVKTQWTDCWGQDEIVCPWCGAVESDSWEYDDCGGLIGEITCGDCSREFFAERVATVTYNSGFTPRIGEWVEGELHEDGFDEAEEQWAIENSMSPLVVVTREDHA